MLTWRLCLIVSKSRAHCCILLVWVIVSCWIVAPACLLWTWTWSLKTIYKISINVYPYALWSDLKMMSSPWAVDPSASHTLLAQQSPTVLSHTVLWTSAFHIHVNSLLIFHTLLRAKNRNAECGKNTMTPTTTKTTCMNK